MSSVEATPAGDPGARWCAVGAHDVRWAEFEGGIVAYHRPSGKTHLLNAVTAELLKDVLHEPKDAAAAAAELAALQSARADEMFTSYVARLLLRLEALGLVECV